MRRGTDLLDALGIGAVEGQGRADGERHLALLGREVDGDHFPGAGGEGTEHRGETDTTQPDHGDALSRAHLRRVDDRADAGEHGASEESRLVEGQRGIELDERAPRDDRVLGKRRAAEMVVDRRAVGLGEPSCARKQRAGAVGRGTRFAQRRPSLAARHAVAAAGNEDERDMVADGEVGDAFAELHHLAGRLVADRHRHRARAVAVDHRQVGVAQTSGADAHEHLVAPRRRELDLLDHQRLRLAVGVRQTDLTQHRSTGSHAVTSRTRLRSSSTRTRLFSL